VSSASAHLSYVAGRLGPEQVTLRQFILEGPEALRQANHLAVKPLSIEYYGEAYLPDEKSLTAESKARAVYLYRSAAGTPGLVFKIATAAADEPMPSDLTVCMGSLC
jgi:hypothetical protein